GVEAAPAAFLSPARRSKEGTGYGPHNVYGELRDVSLSSSPGITSGTDSESPTGLTTGAVGAINSGEGGGVRIGGLPEELASSPIDDTDTAAGSGFSTSTAGRGLGSPTSDDSDTGE
ncbi:unnamed protein product, partial [Sphacelaria rigidula]